jgi:hypothetical protein
MATLEQIEQALRAADAAGNTEDARRLAQAYADMRNQSAPAPVADFSNVRDGSPENMAERYAAAGIDPAGGTDPADGMSGFDKFRAGMGKAFVDSARGLKQAGTEGLGYLAGGGTGNPAMAAANALAGAPRRLDNAATRFADRSLSDQQAVIDQDKALDAPLMNTGAGLAGNVAGYASTLLLPGAAARGTIAARALLPATVAGNAAQGAALGALQPVATGESRLDNAAIGGAFGAGGGVLAKGLGAVAQSARNGVSDAARDIYAAAKARGINLTPAQLSDSRFLRVAQSMLRSVPFTGAQGRYANQTADFTRAVAREIGEDADKITPEVFSGAKSRIGGEFNRLSERNALQVTTDTASKLAAVQREAAQFGGPDAQRVVDSALGRLFEQAQDGAIPGRVYQSLDSQLGKLMKAGGEKSHYLGELRGVLREAMDASVSTADRSAWQTARGQYRDLKTIEPLVAASQDGTIPPAQLLGRVAADRTGKAAMASGRRGGLGELARIGQRMKEPPSSGTAERGAVSGILGGAAYIDPVTGGATALGLNLLSRGLDSQALAKLLLRQNPGMTADVAAQIVRRLSNPAGQATESRLAPSGGR